MTPHPQRKDAQASSFVVCFEGKIQPAHKTGNSAPHRPAGLSLSHTPRAPGRHHPRAGGAPPGTARPQAPAPTLGVGCLLRAAQGDHQGQSHGPRGEMQREAGRASLGQTLEPGGSAQPGPGRTAQGAAPSPGGPTSPVFWPAEPRPPRGEPGSPARPHPVGGSQACGGWEADSRWDDHLPGPVQGAGEAQGSGQKQEPARTEVEAGEVPARPRSPLPTRRPGSSSVSWQEPGPGKGLGQSLARVGTEAGLRRPQDQTLPPAPCPLPRGTQGLARWTSLGELGPDPGRLPGSELRAPRPALRPPLSPCLPGRGVGAPAGLQAKSKQPCLLEEDWFFKLSTFSCPHKRPNLCKAASVSLTEPSSPAPRLELRGRRPPRGVASHGGGCLPTTRGIPLCSGSPPASGTSTRIQDVQLSRRSSAHGPCSPTWPNPCPSEPLAAWPQAPRDAWGPGGLEAAPGCRRVGTDPGCQAGSPLPARLL